MSVKGTILESYRFDARDFTKSHLEDLKYACLMPKANKELQPKLYSAIQYQSRLRRKYFKRVEQSRREAFSKHLRTENFKKVGVPEWLSSKYEVLREKTTQFMKASVPPQVSIFKQERMEWPEITVAPESAAAPHLVATMPPECLNLDGWARLKRAFLPSKYVKCYDPNNPLHTYNADAIYASTGAAAVICGLVQGYGHAKKDLEAYKKDGASQLHESKYGAFRSKEFLWVKSLAKYGVRWGWRVGFLWATIYSISQFMTIYKLRDRIHHYVLGAGIATALYQWKLGLGGMLKTGLIGSVLLGLPIGIAFAGLGYNFRIWYYYTHVESKSQGPFTEGGMTPQQLLLSYERRLAILDLLRTQRSEEINNRQFYRDFIGAE